MIVRRTHLRPSRGTLPCKRRIRAHAVKRPGFAEDDGDEDGMSYWARWMAKTAEGEKVSQPPTFEKKSRLPTISRTAATNARPLDISWWGSLPQAHYISFGLRIGLLPIIELPPSDALAVALSSSQYTGILPAMMAAYGERSTTCLVAFEDRSDAEFVASTLQTNLEASASSGVIDEEFLKDSRPQVLSASPLFLKDVAETRSAVLGMIPRDVISHSVQLSDQALQDLLAQILVSNGPAAAPSAIVDEVPKLPPSPSPSLPSSTTVPPNAFTDRSTATVSKQSKVKFEFSGFKSPSASASKVKQKQQQAASMETGEDQKPLQPRTEEQIPPLETSVNPKVENPQSNASSTSPLVSAASDPFDESYVEAQLRILDALDEKARELQDREREKKQRGQSSDLSDDVLDIETASRLPPTDKLLSRLLEQSMNPVQRVRKPVTGKPSTVKRESSPEPKEEDEAPLEEEEKDALLDEWYSLASKMKKKKTSAKTPSPSPPRPQDPEVMPASSSASISREEEDAYVNAVLQNLEVIAAKVQEAERRTSEAARRAKSGDPAAAVARRSAESQLDALREQMEQLVLLRDSLVGLNEEEELRRKDAAMGNVGIIQEAEFVGFDPSSPPPPPPPVAATQDRLPTPSTIKPPASLSVKDKKSWGSAWGKNHRIKEAGVSLLSNKPSSAPSTPPSKLGGQTSSSSQSLANPHITTSSQRDKESRDDDDEGGLVSNIVSKRAGKERAPKVERSPEERQAIVKDALRFAAASDDEEGFKAGQSSWWKSRFQALWLPTLLYADGSLGFVQIDVSLTEGKKDVRVIAFEDTHDATCCMAVLKQWPEYDWVDMSVSCLPTATIEESIQRAFSEQAENEDKGVSPPSGLCVFRRGKLAMKVGMSMEELTRSVIYQVAAQKSLSRIGYDFNS